MPCHLPLRHSPVPSSGLGRGRLARFRSIIGPLGLNLRAGLWGLRDMSLATRRVPYEVIEGDAASYGAMSAGVEQNTAL